MVATALDPGRGLLDPRRFTAFSGARVRVTAWCMWGGGPERGRPKAKEMFRGQPTRASRPAHLTPLPPPRVLGPPWTAPCFDLRINSSCHTTVHRNRLVKF